MPRMNSIDEARRSAPKRRSGAVSGGGPNLTLLKRARLSACATKPIGPSKAALSGASTNPANT